MSTIMETREYQAIHKFYGARIAQRSQLPLMNHINEGIAILEEFGCDMKTQQAFCLHPLVQNDEDVDVSWSSVYLLALEYKQRANSYLCKPETDHVRTHQDVYELVGPMSQECMYMLIADKRQNQKDFIAHHKGTHARSEQLFRYFNMWLSYLHMEITK